ncbi:16S rRNA (cytidine(1402)-2'-O)-methyltransferase [Demequina sp.]|uniref:16S rRNA (cytidine(1402)-2'-O)-methyltransferase n=1 Tax=Demequina sp. TaxID=2050685 RepID=UPI003D130D53
MTGRIVVAGTPIGNLGDASDRLRDALSAADIVAAEDTRRTLDLARGLGITIGGRLVALHDHNERSRADAVVAEAAGGAFVLLVSDAGMPTVSDPGFRVVEAAVAAGVEVTVLPGPSAVLAALAVSGLPTDRFTFEGFLPRKAGERSRALTALASEPRTLIFFEAPHRLAESLDAMVAAFGAGRRAAVSRELTKTFEETKRGTLADLAAWAADGVKGEIVVCVAGATPTALSLDDALAEAVGRVKTGERAKEVAADLAPLAGVPARELYAAIVAAKGRE